MTDHNLDDLIIDNIEPKNRKTKSFLTIIALFIVVLIVAIILTRTLLKTPTDNTQILEEDTTELIAPELKLQKKAPESEKVEEASLKDIIEEEPKAPEIKAPAPVEPPKPTTVEKVKKQEIKVPQPLEIPAIEEKVPAPEVVVKKEIPVIDEPAPKKVVTPKPVVKEPTVKEPVAKKPAPATKQYYIQVGSFSKDPSTRFLSVIKNSGFDYHLTKADAKGTKKLHIGPYKTRSEVNAALKQVKDRINKSAFVIKK